MLQLIIGKGSFFQHYYVYIISGETSENLVLVVTNVEQSNKSFIKFLQWAIWYSIRYFRSMKNVVDPFITLLLDQTKWSYKVVTTSTENFGVQLS